MMDAEYQIEQEQMREATRQQQQRFANTFATPEGRMVLGDILEAGKVFDEIPLMDGGQLANRNFAIWIARMAQAFDSIYPQLGIAVKEKESETTR